VPAPEVIEEAVSQILQIDPVCGGRVATGSISAIARLLVVPERAPGPDLPDVIAYLEQRRDNSALVAKRAPELEPLAADRRQQLDVIIGDLVAGLHQGSADVRAALKQSDGGNDGA
jgi:hypothetical protein